MSKDRRRAIKAVEKFRKNCEKEIARIGALRRKYDDLRHVQITVPLVGHFVDRLQQKDLMASGDLLWAEQMLSQLRDEPAKTPAAAETAGAAKKRGVQLL